MAIQTYSQNGKTLFRVRVQIKSTKYPSLRVSEQCSGVESPEKAQKIEAQFQKSCERLMLEKELKRSVSGQNWSEVLIAWYESQRDIRVKFGGISIDTLDDYYKSMKKWLAPFDYMPCSEITTLSLMEVFNKMTDAGMSLCHRRKIKRNIKSVFEYGLQSGMINLIRIPTHDLVLKKDEQKRPEILTVGEIRILIETAYAKNHPWRHVWSLALLTGMRNGELFALKWSDVDLDNKLLTVARSYNCRKKAIKSTKAGYWRDVPVSNDCLRILNELRAERGNEEFILPRLARWAHGIQAQELRTFCMENGLPSIKFHTLRACFGTQLLRQGISSAVVMKICGWKDLKTMQHYIRLAGIEVAGATDGLNFMPPEEIAANVVAFKRG